MASRILASKSSLKRHYQEHSKRWKLHGKCFRHGILRAVPRSNQQLLVQLQQVFSMLCFTHRTYIAPRHFHDKSRPPWFSPGTQQDCSEYLRHLMITLHEEERAGQALPEYRSASSSRARRPASPRTCSRSPTTPPPRTLWEGEQAVKGEGAECITIAPDGVLRVSSNDGTLHGEGETFGGHGRKMSVHVESFKGYVPGEPMEGVDQVDHGPLQDSSWARECCRSLTTPRWRMPRRRTATAATQTRSCITCVTGNTPVTASHTIS
ncbi:Ubiquitin carboxyl-terminal hydrolase 35 [Chionoecetes opilio]|uniref:Ubiquitin carboxyl-terminal hydrolase 35 n=1 Tax=Chionoecetes opilio TaxID=41210 RepID=A0A8J4YQ02_CHIOP|nr:Ubiquitin carboxyl-terminal hydrolase 35 [Chionoecetes opilio]